MCEREREIDSERGEREGERMGRKINEREDPKRYILKENCEKIL